MGLSLILLALGVGGCTPSTHRLIKWRDEPVEAAEAQERQAYLLEIIETPWSDTPKRSRDPVWRAEALRVVHRYAGPHASDPRLKAALRAEYFAAYWSGASPLHLQLRAWCLILLDAMDQGVDAPFLVGALEADVAAGHPYPFIGEAALSALAHRREAIHGDPALRRRLLWGLAELSSGLERRLFTPLAAARLEPLMRHLETELKSYAAIVDLLPEASPSDRSAQPLPPPRAISAGALLEVLRWNHRALVAGELHADLQRDPAAMERNMERLLGLAWEPDVPVRTMARMILSQFAPLVLLEGMTLRLEGEGLPLEEDFGQLGNLIVALDLQAQQGKAPTEPPALLRPPRRASRRRA
jgi:hypothetical protein